MRIFNIGLCLAGALASEICYYYQECDMGCYSDQPPWGGTDARPNNHLPQTPTDINTHFGLDTREQTGHDLTFGSSNSIMTSTFNPENPTVFIIHGYFDTGEEGWLKRMSASILELQPTNVIRVDWHEGSRTAKYGQAATDIQIVAASVECLLDSLMAQKPFLISDLMCVGHSLGAQACGYVGQRVLKKFGQKLPVLHGLDPAEPYFKGAPEEVCLSPNDADFVSVLHSDAAQFMADGVTTGLGLSYPAGHIDFWPNNGTDHPGCEQGLIGGINDNGGLWEGIRDFVACNHLRSVRFFEESIKQTCEFRSYSCDSWTDFEQGYCLDGWNVNGETIFPEMGWNSVNYIDMMPKTELNMLYLKTSQTAPFCDHAYSTRVTFGSTDKRLDLDLFYNLIGPEGKSERITVNSETFRPEEGMNLRFEFGSTLKLSAINSVDVMMDGRNGLIGREHSTITRMYLEDGEEQQTYTFCTLESHMQCGKTYNFFKC